MYESDNASTTTTTTTMTETLDYDPTTTTTEKKPNVRSVTIRVVQSLRFSTIMYDYVRFGQIPNPKAWRSCSYYDTNAVNSGPLPQP